MVGVCSCGRKLKKVKDPFLGMVDECSRCGMVGGETFVLGHGYMSKKKARKYGSAKARLEKIRSHKFL